MWGSHFGSTSIIQQSYLSADDALAMIFPSKQMWSTLPSCPSSFLLTNNLVSIPGESEETQVTGYDSSRIRKYCCTKALYSFLLSLSELCCPSCLLTQSTKVLGPSLDLSFRGGLGLTQVD